MRKKERKKVLPILVYYTLPSKRRKIVGIKLAVSCKNEKKKKKRIYGQAQSRISPNVIMQKKIGTFSVL